MLGTFSYFSKGLATTRQQYFQRALVALALSVVFACSYWSSMYCQSQRVVGMTTLGVPQSIVCRERRSVYSKEVTRLCGWYGECTAAASFCREHRWPLPSVSCWCVLAEAVCNFRRFLKKCRVQGSLEFYRRCDTFTC